MASIADILKRPDQKETVVKHVHIDGQVVLKIKQHCDGALPQLGTGQLLGLDVGQTLEVTDCFPFPGNEDDGDEQASSNYQLEMMRCLREVNVDNNTVGWYQAAPQGAYQTEEFINIFVNYHDSIKKCICLVYDPQTSARGHLDLKAVRLREAFIDLVKEQKTTALALRDARIAWRDVFIEVPIKVTNSSLAQAFVCDANPGAGATAADLERLNLGTAAYLSKGIMALNESIDDLFLEQAKVAMYHKNLARQQQQQAAWLVKRRQENAARRAAGEEPLPEEDPAFRAIPEPPMMDSFLVTNQIAHYCDHISAAAERGVASLYLMQGLQQAVSGR